VAALALVGASAVGVLASDGHDHSEDRIEPSVGMIDYLESTPDQCGLLVVDTAATLASFDLPEAVPADALENGVVGYECYSDNQAKTFALFLRAAPGQGFVVTNDVQYVERVNAELGKERGLDTYSRVRLVPEQSGSQSLASLIEGIHAASSGN
jgi:hypothetical protein